ncbi:MAG: hypothetical protein HFJ17_02710 [Clostridia bacterium]|nr:hypothetical protein [Clostridia bacterium]
MIEETRKIFKDKGFNEQTIYYIDNFIEEFNDLFSEYVSKDELINRLSAVLNSDIEFVKDLKAENGRKVNGMYVHGNTKIDADKNEEEIKEIVFHELIHAITDRGDYTGFRKEYNIEDLEDTKIITAHGITEGFTQYVTELRNRKYYPEKKGHSYPILSELTEILAEDIIGKKEFLDIAFNRSEDFEDHIYNIDLPIGFIDDFDVIWQNERFVIENKAINEIFGIQRDNKLLSEVKNSIVKSYAKFVLQKDITSIEEFNEVYSKINRYETLLGCKDYSVFCILIEKLDGLGIPRDEFIDQLPDDIKKEYDLQKDIIKFIEKGYEDVLKIMSTQDMWEIFNNKYIEFADSKYFETYRQEITKSIFGTELENMYDYLDSGLAEILSEKGYNPKTLAVEGIIFEEFKSRPDLEVEVFNIYDTSENKYVGTFSFSFVDAKIEEFSIEESDDIKGYLESNGLDVDNSAILKDGSGRILLYDGDNKYTIAEQYGDIYRSKQVNYNESYLETEEKSLKSSISRYKWMKDQFSNQMPKNIEENFISNIQSKKREISYLKNKGKITPMDIEDISKECTLEDIEDMMKQLTETEIDSKEMFERGVGYEEH